MTSFYRNPAGSDWDDLFEPETSGNGIGDNFYRRNDGSVIRYAARSLGGKIPDVAYTSSLGYGDVTNMWAGRGTVAYLQNPPTYGQSAVTAAESVTWGDRLYSDIFLNLYPDGTWSITSVTTNYVTDNVPAYGQYGIYNYSGGRTLAAGYWASNPGAGIGNGYQVEAAITSFVSGWRDYPVSAVGAPGVDHPGGFKGPSSIQQNGIAGAGVRGLGGVVSIGIILQAQGTSGNSSYKDNNQGLSWYNQGTASVTIRSVNNGNIAVNATVTFAHNEIRWGPTNWPTPLGGSGGGGGGGGGGGCVTIDSFMYDGDVAGNFQVTRDLWVTDPYHWDGQVNSSVGEVLLSEPELQPCVLIRTEHGAELECSTTAPIPTREQGFVVAPLIGGLYVPVARKEDIDAVDTPYSWSQVIEVRDIGLRWVQKLYVKDRCFWASKDGKLFILHHNLKPAAGN
jgi:hypothetical protein